MVRSRISVAAAFLPLALAGSALAQPTAGADATAESLFRDGRDLMAKGQVSEACKKFEASFEIEALAGTLLNLANCHEQEGRTASAWAEFLRAASMSRSAAQGDREEVARERARALEPKLMRLRIDVPEAALVEGLEITRGGQPVESVAWGSPIPVDPGEQVIRASAPGKKPREDRVQLVTEGSTVVFELAPLEDAPPEPVAAEPPPPPPPPEPTPTPQPTEVGADVDPGSSQRTIGLVVGAVGAAGVVAGTVFGAFAKGDWEDAQNEGCDAGTCPTQTGQDFSEDANREALFGTVGVAGGGALLLGGLILYLTAPEANATTALVVPGPDSLTLGVRGAF